MILDNENTDIQHGSTAPEIESYHLVSGRTNEAGHPRLSKHEEQRS